MAQTIVGGAYLRPDGKTWQNAQGEEIAAPKPEELEALQQERERTRERQPLPIAPPPVVVQPIVPPGTAKQRK